MALKRKAETDIDFDLPAKSNRVEEVVTRGHNALMQLNEIGIKGLKWTIEQMNNIFPQRFKATCLFTEPFTGMYEVIPTGVIFVTEGISKSACRHEIAAQIMNRISKNEPNTNPPIPSDSTLVNDIYNNAVNQTSFNIATIEDAVRLLNEKVQDIEYDIIYTGSRYCCSVFFKESLFQAMGSNKKTAKRNVAMEILKKHFKYTFIVENASQSATSDSTASADNNNDVLNCRRNFCNQVQAMVKNGYEKLTSTLDVQVSKRKVIAGIIISRKLESVFPIFLREADPIDPLKFYTETGWSINADNEREILKLVTISSGTKCLSATEPNVSGMLINDCHAEVIAKRALQYFLHRTIERLTRHIIARTFEDCLYGCDILEEFSTEDSFAYKLKDDVQFHLYVSNSPCGDCRIFFPKTASNGKCQENGTMNPCLNLGHEGLLRTKIQCGEGTVPTKMNFIEAWDRILDGERLPTMSCSDKICLWNVLGLQGALLSNVLCEPIYLDSITIGSVFQSDHCERALFDRVAGVTDSSDWVASNVISNVDDKDRKTDVEHGELVPTIDSHRLFRVSKPSILTVIDLDERCPGKSSWFSGNWILGEDCFELVSAHKGVTTVDNVPSRLCKLKLFQSFLSIFKWLPFICPETGMLFYGDVKKLVGYPDHAVGAATYYRKKKALMAYFEQRGLGRWARKCAAQDCFIAKVV